LNDYGTTRIVDDELMMMVVVVVVDTTKVNTLTEKKRK